MIVVAISGPSGSGKTSVIKQLAKRHACPYLLFDDYVDEYTYPADMQRWLEAGADVSGIKTSKMVLELQARIQGNQYDDRQYDYLFVEEPFGRGRDSIASLINYVVLLDMPLEICLSRIMSRNILRYGGQSIDIIQGYLSKYEDYLRDIYVKVTRQVRQDSDLVISQVSPVCETAGIISDWLATRAS